MERVITGFEQDAERHWVARLACGHRQHVRHNPPWTSRPWVITARGRAGRLGEVLDCRKCDEGAARDWWPLTLVGMSNIGKSRWARRLAASAGYQVVDCDALVMQRLLPEAGAAALQGLAAWMGQPGDARYPERSARLLAVEHEVMAGLVARLAADDSGRALVIDTGGSVIHAGADVLAGLRRHTRVVHLMAPEAHIGRLYARYLSRPKPLVWADAWQPLPGETVAAARERCYPLLLRLRAARYAELAHVNLSWQAHSRRGAGARWLLDRAAAVSQQADDMAPVREGEDA